MEPHEPSPAKLKLWRWLLLLCVITVAVGSFVWWELRNERLHFVETIWSDSLARHGKSSVATGQRQKIGEIWSLTHTSGIRVFGRGLSRNSEGQFPVFPANNAFHRGLSDQLLAERRMSASRFGMVTWPEWWERFKAPRLDSVSIVSCKAVFVGPQAVALRQEVSEYGGGVHHLYSVHGRNFVERDGELHELKLDELFHGTDWGNAISDLCLIDLKRQGVTWAGPVAAKGVVFTEFNAGSLNHFTFAPDGLRFYFVPGVVAGRAEVLIPWEQLADHLRPDGPHRLFQ